VLILLYWCVTMPSRYAVRSTANPQATDEAERPHSLCSDVICRCRQLSMPQATDEAERLH